jgi:hypothetical protein
MTRQERQMTIIPRSFQRKSTINYSDEMIDFDFLCSSTSTPRMVGYYKNGRRNHSLFEQPFIHHNNESLYT